MVTLSLTLVTIPQAFRIVTDDVGSHIDPFIHIGRRIDKIFIHRMVNGFPQAVKDRGLAREPWQETVL